jgi:chitin disaccharide deacetylase
MKHSSTSRTLLIVNADDFGQSLGINQGICETFERGIVTSASLMVRWYGSVEAARYSREHPELSVGLHVDFGEFVYRDGSWVSLYEVVSTKDETACYRELWRQIDQFHALTGQTPTHLDSHQHIHRRGFLRQMFSEAADRLGIPLRDATALVRYCGAFYGQTDNGAPLPDNITDGALKEIVAGLAPGYTELGCHPAKAVDMDSGYREPRLAEFAMLASPDLRCMLSSKGVELCSFHDLREAKA